MSSEQHIHDLIGIGFGPSNIALIIALEEQGLRDGTLFLEARREPSWQPGMVLSGTDIQHNPLRDFVTPRNPASPYGFLSYLKAKGRLLDFLNLDAPYPPRSEYEGYLKWVADQFSDNVVYDCRVDAISRVRVDGEEVIRITAGDTDYLARNVSLATGRSANIPAVFAPFLGPRVAHLNSYLDAAGRWMDEGVRHVTVVGGSQSAIEIVLDLLNRDDDLRVCSLSRSFGFKQKDLSPFTERIYMPDFVDYFYDASTESQQQMSRELWRSNYGAADHDVIQALNMIQYEQLVLGEKRLQIAFNRRVDCVQASSRGGYVISVTDVHARKASSIYTDAIVLATGFRNFGQGDAREAMLPMMDGLRPHCRFREDGGVGVNRDYSLQFNDDRPGQPRVFLNGLCEASHGFGDAGSFSLLWLRSSIIAESLGAAKREASSSLSNTMVAQ